MRKSALVIGGGPAGASSALGLLRAGWRVTLAETRKTWSGRVCGAFLSSEAAAALRNLDLLGKALDSGALPVERIRISGPGGTESELDLREEGGSGLAWPRKNLEDMLLAEVESRGGLIVRGRRDPGTDTGGEKVSVPRIEPPPSNFDLTINAAGRFAGLEPRASSGWYGWNAEFEGLAQAPGALSLHFYRGGYVGVLTFRGGLSNVCGLSYRQAGEKESVDDTVGKAMERQSVLKSLLALGSRRGPWRFVGPLPFRTSMRPEPDSIPAGDAAAVGDPFMGEGIGRALGSGPLLESCLGVMEENPWDPARLRRLYEGEWRRRYGNRLRMGFIARGLLRTAFAAPFLHWAFRSPRRIQRLLPLFHGA